MNIGFAKIGRSWEPRIGSVSTVGGDTEVLVSLQRLMLNRPNDRFVLIGRTRVDPRPELDAGERIFAPWYDDPDLVGVKSRTEEAHEIMREKYALDLDALVVWLGQTGGATSTKTPLLDGTFDRKPLMADINYSAYLVELINAWRALYPDRDVIWMNPDPRNAIRFGDLHHPQMHPFLAQYNATRNGKYYVPATNSFTRYVQRFEYAAVELTGVPTAEVREGPLIDAETRVVPFGMIVNENARRANPRGKLIAEWVGDPTFPLHGTWTAAGLADMGRTEPVTPLPRAQLKPTLASWRATLSLPASGSGWATAKPWEMFAAGVVCFMHPAYDDQHHIVNVASPRSNDERLLAKWLRPSTATEFRDKLREVTMDDELYEQLAQAQYKHLLDRMRATRGGVYRVLERLDEHE